MRKALLKAEQDIAGILAKLEGEHGIIVTDVQVESASPQYIGDDMSKQRMTVRIIRLLGPEHRTWGVS